jgi:hypothetical protein
MADAPITSFASPNYSGMLFNKGNTNVPFSTLIANRSKITSSVEFVTGSEYQSGGGTQPAISEEASLTAPYATFVTRSQKTNVTQIFQETVMISYTKESNMGTLSGVNISGQIANPPTEMDFQIAARMQKIARDIEATFVAGAYSKATTDAEVNKTCGIMTAITTNILNLDGAALRVWDVADAMRKIYEANAPTSGLVLWVDPVAMFQINADAEQNGLTIVPSARNINGLAISSLLTPFGEIGLYLGQFLPAGYVGLFNPSVISRVEQPVPGKGNFFMEELAKVGAGIKYQIFGQLGLDYGPEWYHAKIGNIATTFTKPPMGRRIYTMDPIATVSVDAQITSAVLDKTTVEADNANKVGVATVNYNIKPAEDATLAYLWQIRAASGTTWTDLTSAYTNYNTSELTIKAADVGKHYRCKVTATGSATGIVYSNECTVVEAAGDA